MRRVERHAFRPGRLLRILAAEALAEEADHPVNGFAGRLTLAVHEANREDAVRRFGMLVRRASGHFYSFEAVAKFAPQSLEAGRSAKQDIAGETHAKHAQAFLADSPTGIVERRGSNVKRCRLPAVDRQRE